MASIIIENGELSRMPVENGDTAGAQLSATTDCSDIRRSIHTHGRTLFMARNLTVLHVTQ